MKSKRNCEELFSRTKKMEKSLAEEMICKSQATMKHFNGNNVKIWLM